MGFSGCGRTASPPSSSGSAEGSSKPAPSSAAEILSSPESSAGGSSAGGSSAGGNSSLTPEPEQDAVRQRMAGMTLREKVGQVFFIRPDALDFTLTGKQVESSKMKGVTIWNDTLKQNLKEYPAGGFALFGKNIQTPAQLSGLTEALKDASVTPPFLGVDEEGGTVSRLAKNGAFQLPTYESMTAVGNTGDPENARQVGLTIGGYLKKYGFNLDFAPVADVNTNPDNPVIGIRAFSSDPNAAAAMVAAEIGGLHESGMMSVIKHFPGHGDTKTDTHLGYATTEKTWEEMQSCELIPFEAGIKAGADMVMAAHITAVNVTSDGLPTSLSHEMLTDRLRGELGYDGIIITDALAMGAVSAQYSSGEAAVTAVQAGVDILLMPYDYRQAFDAVLTAVSDGTIPEERLDESVYRILSLKEKYGLLDP